MAATNTPVEAKPIEIVCMSTTIDTQKTRLGELVLKTKGEKQSRLQDSICLLSMLLVRSADEILD